MMFNFSRHFPFLVLVTIDQAVVNALSNNLDFRTPFVLTVFDQRSHAESAELSRHHVANGGDESLSRAQALVAAPTEGRALGQL